MKINTTTKPTRYQNIRILVLRANWLGNTGLSAFNAFLRAGTWAYAIAEEDYIPLRWHSLPMRVIGKLLRPFAVREFNRALLREARLLKPHLFLAVKGGHVQAETLRAMRKMGITLYCFYPDVSFMVHGQYLVSTLKEYDWVFTTKSFGPQDLKEQLGIDRSSYLPHAFDPDVHRPRPITPESLETLGCDVSFIGGWSLKKQRVLEALIERRPGLNLKVWGDRWHRLPPESPLRGYTTFRPVFGIGYATAISCSKINLGLLHEAVPGASSGDLITSRTFHIPACGGLLLHERTDDLLKIFKENESCVCFDDVDELVEKVDWLLSDERSRIAIAARGKQVVEQGHSWDHRVRTILNHYLQR